MPEADEDLSEQECIRRARAGESAAFGHLVQMHQAAVRAFAARYVESSDDVFDIVQDTFLRAYETLDRFDPARPFGPWLRGICRHRMLRFFRARSVRHHATRGLVDAALAARIEKSDADEAERLAGRVRALKACIAALPEEQRELLHLRYHHGIAVTEIARKLNQSAAAVSMRLLRIRDALRSCVEKQEGVR